jgi:hypothetical protein
MVLPVKNKTNKKQKSESKITLIKISKEQKIIKLFYMNRIIYCTYVLHLLIGNSTTIKNGTGK